MTMTLRQSLEDYLAMRREFGYQLEKTGHLLAQFVTFMEERGADVVTVELALAWASLPTDCRSAWSSARLGMVRGFARYLHAFDPRTGVPPIGLLPRGKKRATPFLYSNEQVRSLMAAARKISSPRRALTTEAIIGLLAASGLRVGEALALDRPDVDFVDGVLIVRHAKFNKSRLVPLHPSCVAALRVYATRRDQLIPHAGRAFFASPTGKRVHHCNFSATFHALVNVIGLEVRPSCRARVHDLRHSFAVNVLTRWNTEGADVSTKLPSLSTYLGHVDPADTYWYLSATPELFEHAVIRLESTYEVES
jgi:integrase